jgi:hypothetical protein
MKLRLSKDFIRQHCIPQFETTTWVVYCDAITHFLLKLWQLLPHIGSIIVRGVFLNNGAANRLSSL